MGYLQEALRQYERDHGCKLIVATPHQTARQNCFNLFVKHRFEWVTGYRITKRDKITFNRDKMSCVLPAGTSWAETIDGEWRELYSNAKVINFKEFLRIVKDLLAARGCT